MTDLNELLRDFKDKRLAYKEINRAAHEALMDGIVAEIEALKRVRDPMDFPLPDGRIAVPVHPEMLEHLKAQTRTEKDAEGLPKAAVDKIVADAVAEHAVAVKRGPGRPPKAEAA